MLSDYSIRHIAGRHTRTMPQMPSLRLAAQYVSGLPEDKFKLKPGNEGQIAFIEDSVVLSGHRIGGEVRHKVSISELRYISYEDAGTKSNVAALAVFGILGLGARRSWSLVTFGLSERDAQFLVREPTYRLRAIFDEASQSMPGLTDLVREGPPPSAEAVNAEPVRGQSSLDELERLADLYERGLLTDDEYTAMKAKVIADN